MPLKRIDFTNSYTLHIYNFQEVIKALKLEKARENIEKRKQGELTKKRKLELKQKLKTGKQKQFKVQELKVVLIYWSPVASPLLFRCFTLRGRRRGDGIPVTFIQCPGEKKTLFLIFVNQPLPNEI